MLIIFAGFGKPCPFRLRSRGCQNDHPAPSRVPDQLDTVTFYNSAVERCHKRVRHEPIAGTPVHCEVMSLRPASRDKPDDARSGNINPVRPVRDDLAITNNRQTIEQASYLLQSLHNLQPARPSKVS
jgi:hypothetical protein